MPKVDFGFIMKDYLERERDLTIRDGSSTILEYGDIIMSSGHSMGKSREESWSWKELMWVVWE